jgi:hypothetical protein
MTAKPAHDFEIEAAAGEPFRRWLGQRGSEVLAPTNPYEVLRFTAPNGAGVVYKKRTGKLTWNKQALAAWNSFVNKNPWRVLPKLERQPLRHLVPAMIERDGDLCFFCGGDRGDDITVEHLVPKVHGGPDSLANLALAHADCNARADNLSVAEKVRLRDQMHTAAKP